MGKDDKKELLEEVIGYVYEFGFFITNELFQINEKFSKYNLTPKQIRILKILYKNDITINELAQKIDTTSSSLGQIIARLEESGFVKRLINTDDRREILVSLDKKGFEFFDDVYNLYKNLTNTYINEFNDEKSNEELEKMRTFYKKIIELSKNYME